MAALILKEGRSYMYKGYVFQKGFATDVDEADVAYLLGTGNFEMMGGIVEPTDAEVIMDDAINEPIQYGGKTLNEMNKSELETFAAYRDVDIKGANTKAAIIKKLREALPASELEGKIYYGSPTMVELQDEIL